MSQSHERLQRGDHSRATEDLVSQAAPSSAHETSEATADAGDAAVRRMAQSANDPVPPGTEVYTSRPIGPVTYHHAGVYVGNGEVVHVHATVSQAWKNLLHHHP